MTLEYSIDGRTTKYRNYGNNGDWKRVLLFAKGLRLQKFYRIGKWFRKSKRLIWKEIQALMQRTP